MRKINYRLSQLNHPGVGTLELAAVELVELWFICIIVSIIHSCLKKGIC